MTKILTTTGLTALSLTLLMGAAFAQDLTPKAAEPKAEAQELPTYKPITLTIDNYVVFDNKGNALSTHELDIVIEGQLGDWLLGVDAWGGLIHDYDANSHTIEQPGIEFYGINDAVGEIHLWDADAALSNACIQPTGGTSHFGTEDYLTFGTCGGYGGKTILYVTPEFNGFGVQLSASRDLTDQTVNGEVDGSASAALTYAATTEGGIDIAASFGVDAALSVNGGLPSGQNLPVTVQAGVNVGWEDWIFGAAAQYEFASLNGGDGWGAGIGVSKLITDEFVVMAELSGDGYDLAGVSYRETSIGVNAEYQILPNTFIDAAVSLIHRTGSDGTDEFGTVFGAGLSLVF
ncbi:porin [Devosia sp. 2618]|uniref:porin n=1 Tax=Devosia sp. 2618 TaxID=3156454 RepID=UPI003391E19E